MHQEQKVRLHISQKKRVLLANLKDYSEPSALSSLLFTIKKEKAMTVILRKDNVVIVDRMIVNGSVYSYDAYSEDSKPVKYFKEGDFYYLTKHDNRDTISDEHLRILGGFFSIGYPGLDKIIPAPKEIESILETVGDTFLFFFNGYTVRITDEREIEYKKADRINVWNCYPDIMIYVLEYFKDASLIDIHRKMADLYIYASNGKQGVGDVTALLFKDGKETTTKLPSELSATEEEPKGIVFWPERQTVHQRNNKLSDPSQLTGLLNEIRDKVGPLLSASGTKLTPATWDFMFEEGDKIIRENGGSYTVCSVSPTGTPLIKKDMQE